MRSRWMIFPGAFTGGDADHNLRRRHLYPHAVRGHRRGAGGGRAHETLARTGVGIFRRTEALALERLADEGLARLVPMDRSLQIPQVAVGEADSARLGLGQPVAASDPPAADVCALLYQGRLRALARLENGFFQPFKVFDTGGKSA